MTTKLSLEIEYPDKDVELVVMSKPGRWDLTVGEMLEMFKRLMRGAGYYVERIGEIGDDDC